MLFSFNLAYIDPSVMTYSIQAIAGVAIAIGAVVAVFWRKAKKMVSDKLGLDNNTKKEVELTKEQEESMRKLDEIIGFKK